MSKTAGACLEDASSESGAAVDLYAGVMKTPQGLRGYIGIAKDLAARTAGRFEDHIEVVLQLTRSQARVVETKAIQIFGDATHWSAETSLANVIRSVSATNPLFDLVNATDLEFVDMGAVLGAIGAFFDQYDIPWPND